MKIAILTKFVLRGSLRQEMVTKLTSQGFNDVDLVFMGCFSGGYDGDFSKGDLRAAREDFTDNLRRVDPDAVLTMGNESLFVATGHSGVMKYRGEIQHDGLRPIMPTIALGAIERNPSQIQLLYADIRGLYAQVYGSPRRADAKPRRIHVVKSDEGMANFEDHCQQAEAVAFDLETSSFDEQAADSFIVSLGATTLRDGVLECFAFPLRHDQSPVDSSWLPFIQRAARAMADVPIRIAHNAKFDCRWLAQFDAAVPCNFDTMLASHLLDENRFKGLKPLAQMLLDATTWSIDIASGKNAPPWYTQHDLRDILRYNAMDTWHTMRLYRLFEKELRQDQRLYDLFTRLVMPASQSLVHIERRGVYVHREALEEGASIVSSELSRIHDALMQYVPTDVVESRSVNFNPSNFARWFLFDHLEFPVLREGKTGPSMAEDIMTRLAADYPHPVLDLMVERVKWQKFESSFFNPYQELITDESRLHTTFKLSGTVTGRLSSGKMDADKVTGTRKSALRGINLQQVPRDPLVRGVFGSAPGWAFVEADYSQIELRVAAEVSGEPTLRALYARGEDVHMAMAMRMTGKPASKVTKDERKKAKAVNFGFLYGMGPGKFVETAWNNYGVKVTLEEAKAARAAFFGQFPELIRWHARQRRLAHKFRRVQSPLGRIRHLPDIVSEDQGVVGEAERQAINSPVQAMASDMCLFSLVLLDRQFRKRAIRASPVGTVHDSILFEICDDDLLVAIPLIKRVMESPPIEKNFGVQLSVPVVSDIAIGRAWGKTIECPGDIIESNELKGWLDENYLASLVSSS